MDALDTFVRAATREDAEAIAAMAAELAAAVDDSPPAIDVAHFLDEALGPDPWCQGFVAARGPLLVGYALVCRGCEAHTGQRRLWLADLFVRPSVRRGGVGRALIGAIADHALALGCAFVCWDLWSRNHAGAAFYGALAAEKVTDLVQLRLGVDRLSALARQH
jgi:GNAT superfamily N-acetyltransferase